MKKRVVWIGMILVLALILSGCPWHRGGHDFRRGDGHGHFNYDHGRSY